MASLTCYATWYAYDLLQSVHTQPKPACSDFQLNQRKIANHHIWEAGNNRQICFSTISHLLLFVCFCQNWIIHWYRCVIKNKTKQKWNCGVIAIRHLRSCYPLQSSCLIIQWLMSKSHCRYRLSASRPGIKLCEYLRLLNFTLSFISLKCCC